MIQGLIWSMEADPDISLRVIVERGGGVVGFFGRENWISKQFVFKRKIKWHQGVIQSENYNNIFANL